MNGLIKSFLFVACTFIFLGAKERKGSPSKKFLFDRGDILFSCSYTSTITPDDCIPEIGGSYNGESLDIARVLRQILLAMTADSSVKVQANFFPYACDFPEPVFKALTKKSDSSRYILYSKSILNKLVSKNTDWVAYSIFAHEVGHHFLGHSIKSPKDLVESRERELQADFFCGFILKRLKSTLQQAQSGINVTGRHPTDEEEFTYSHPTKSKRLSAIRVGFEAEDSSKITMRNLLNIDSLERHQKGLEFLFNKTLMLILDNRFDEALILFERFTGSLTPSQKAVVLNNRAFIKQSSGDLIGAIKDYNSALALDDDQFIILENRGKLKKLSSDKAMVAEGKEDIKLANQIKVMNQVNF